MCLGTSFPSDKEIVSAVHLSLFFLQTSSDLVVDAPHLLDSLLYCTVVLYCVALVLYCTLYCTVHCTVVYQFCGPSPSTKAKRNRSKEPQKKEQKFPTARTRIIIHHIITSSSHHHLSLFWDGFPDSSQNTAKRKLRISTRIYWYTECVCVFSSHPFWTSSSLDVPAGVTQEEGHTGFLIHLPSVVRALSTSKYLTVVV